MKLLGVSRALRFSPHCEERDAAIFSEVARLLREQGCSVEIADEDALAAVPACDGAFSMARSRRALQLLADCEQAGLAVVNSPARLLTTTRTSLARLFSANAVPTPQFWEARSADPAPEGLAFPLWLKRDEVSTQTRQDVQFVCAADALPEALRSFAARDIADVLLVAHVAGDLVKFYGVEGTDFFYYYYPTLDGGFSKFGLEAHNGSAHGYAFDRAALKRAADKAARAGGIFVYGGDAVVEPNGAFSIIDFNDWPTFAPCRADAARAIAQRIVMAVQNKH